MSDDTKDIIEAHAEVVLDTTEHPANSPVWLEARRSGVGGSDAAVALGMAPMSWGKGPYTLYADKVGEYTDNSDSEAMMSGRRLERVIIEGFAEDKGHPTAPYPYMLRSRKWPFMMVNLDGITLDMPAVVEAKNVGIQKAAEWIDEDDLPRVPDHYALQGQHACAVTGLPGVWFAVLIGGQHWRYVYVERDEALIADLVEMLEEFWHKVQTRTPPSTTAADSDAVKAMYRMTDLAANEVRAEVPAEYADWVVQRAQLKAEIKWREEALERYENSMKAELGDAAIATVGGKPLYTWKGHNVTRVKPDLLRERYPAIAEEVSVTKVERRIYVPKSAALVAATKRGSSS